MPIIPSPTDMADQLHRLLNFGEIANGVPGGVTRKLIVHPELLHTLAVARDAGTRHPLLDYNPDHGYSLYGVLIYTDHRLPRNGWSLEHHGEVRMIETQGSSEVNHG